MQILRVDNYFTPESTVDVLSYCIFHMRVVSNWVEMEVCTQTARIAICVPALAVKYSLLLLYDERAHAESSSATHTAVTITISHDIAAAQVLLPAAFRRAIINYSAAERICSTYAQNYIHSEQTAFTCYTSLPFLYIRVYLIKYSIAICAVIGHAYKFAYLKKIQKLAQKICFLE